MKQLFLAFLLVAFMAAGAAGAPLPRGVQVTTNSTTYEVNLQVKDSRGRTLAPRFITVIPDIDCTIVLQDRDSGNYRSGTLSMESTDEATVDTEIPLVGGERNVFEVRAQLLVFKTNGVTAKVITEY